jgi:hypothetical protein
MVKRYDAPNAVITREALGQTEAGGAATTEYAKFFQFQKYTLRKAHFLVTTAGTTTGAASGFGIYNGTTSIGVVTAGSDVAGTTYSSGALDSAVAALGQVSVKSITDAAVKALVSYEYDIPHDAVQS